MDISAAATSKSSTAIAMTFITLVLCLPLIWYVLRVWRPLRVNANATGLSRGWQLTHVTGVVLATQQHSRVTGNVWSHAGQVGGSVRTDVYDTLNLRTATGQSTVVQVVNFNVTAFPDQVASFWTANKGSSSFTFAVLNHTAQQQNVNDQQVFKIMVSPTLQIVFVIYLGALALPVAFLSVFGGACIPFLLWLTLLILFVVGQKRVRRQFDQKGMATIWRMSQEEARQLLSEQR